VAEQLTITVPEGKIRDFVDGIFRNDTPEEYVRQTLKKG
jgi:type I restriction enzyme M protein